MKYLIYGSIIIAGLLLALRAFAADERSSFYDRDGHYQGHSIKNQFGNTSYYDHNGHFLGTEKKERR